MTAFARQRFLDVPGNPKGAIEELGDEFLQARLTMHLRHADAHGADRLADLLPCINGERALRGGGHGGAMKACTRGTQVPCGGSRGASMSLMSNCT